MRKVLSFVLVLSLVLGSFSMAFAAAPKDVVGTPSEDAVTVLSDLGVVSGYEDGTYKPENIVTRAEMAVLVIRALGLSDYVSGTAKSSFKDMAGYGWAEGYVAYAQSLGFVSGYPDGTFKPGQTVSYDEVASMLVRALGYTTDSLVGTWPANFVVKAKALGILDGVKSGAAGANRGDVAIMLYQTLDEKIGTVNKDGIFVETNSGTLLVPVYDTMLARLGAQLVNGGNAFVLLNSHSNTAKINTAQYLGAFVKAYANKDGDIIGVASVESKFVKGKLTSATTFELDDADSTEYSVAANAANGAWVFQNGTNVATVSSITTGAVYTFAVDLSGKTIKDIYSVADWAVSADDLFTNDDAEDIEKDSKLFGKKFKLNDDKEIDTNSFALLGVDSLDDIKKDNVVYVYVDGQNFINRIEVGTKTVAGEVTKIKNNKYTIDGDAYAMVTDVNLSNEDLITLDVEDVVKAKLDYAGKIYAVEKTAGSADSYAVVLDIADYAGGLTGNDAKIKLFLADGTNKTFNVDYKAVGDDSIITSNTGIWQNAAAEVTTGAIVKYGLDKDGEINAMELLTDASAAPVSGQKITEKGYFNGSKVASDAVIFTFSKTFGTFTKAAGDYEVTTLDKTLDTTIANAQVYTKNAQVLAMIVDASSVSNVNNVYGVVNAWEKNGSDDGFGIDMLVAGADKYYDATKSFSGEIDGKLYLVKFALNGAVNNLVDAKSAGGIKDGAFIVATTGDGITVSGKVVTISGTAIGAGNTSKTTVTSSTPGAPSGITAVTKITLDADVVVYAWDAVEGEYTVKAVRDIAGADHVEFYDVFDNDGVYDIVLIK